MDEWIDIADKILAAIEAKKGEFVQVAQLEPDEEYEILRDTVAQVLQNEEMDGHLHWGPAGQ